MRTGKSGFVHQAHRAANSAEDFHPRGKAEPNMLDRKELERMEGSALFQAPFPRTRYQGSKRKLADAIVDQLSGLDYVRVLDAFGGTGAVAHSFKRAGKAVTYNDLLAFNHQIGLALIENDDVRLADSDMERINTYQPDYRYPDFIERTFKGIYFTKEENRWLDVAATNIFRLYSEPASNPLAGVAKSGRHGNSSAKALERRGCEQSQVRGLPDSLSSRIGFGDREAEQGANMAYKQSLAWFALFQSAMAKRPYNLFHRKNLYMRTAEIRRSFGNKASWDRPFPDHFRAFAREANRAVFRSIHPCRATCADALDVPGDFDLVYIDPPYVRRTGTGVDYRSFYHFLEGLVAYGQWPERIDRGSKHLRLVPQPNPWCDPRANADMFRRLFRRFEESALVVSYRSDGMPTIDELVSILGKVKRRVAILQGRRQPYALSNQRCTREVLLIGSRTTLSRRRSEHWQRIR